MCLDKCRSCYLRKGLSSPFSSYSDGIDLKGVRAYTLDKRDSLVELEYGRYKDKKICLVINFYKNGSSTPIILKGKEKSYFLPAYFREAKAFDTLDDAKDYWLKDAQKIGDSGGYY